MKAVDPNPFEPRSLQEIDMLTSSNLFRVQTYTLLDRLSIQRFFLEIRRDIFGVV